jgi:hypothetical protein
MAIGVSRRRMSRQNPARLASDGGAESGAERDSGARGHAVDGTQNPLGLRAVHIVSDGDLKEAARRLDAVVVTARR